MQSKTINSYILYISIIGLSFLIGIPQAINQWLHKDIFYKYFNKGETHWYYDLVVMVLLSSTYFYSSRLEKQLKISPFIISITLFILILLANYRISYNEYLTPIYFNTCNNLFKYFDALFLIPFIIIGAYYINYNSDDNIDSKCKKCEKLKEKCICKKDILNTKSKVEYFLNTLESDFNFYGIVGKWGVGKTFFLNLLKIKLKEANKNNVIIEFSPWKFNTTDLMIQDFSNKIENELESKGLIKKNDYRKFSKEFIGSINTIKFSLVEFSTVFNTASNSDEQFEKINNALKDSDHKFYVLIDDLDRLQNDEIYKVLIFLRNVFNFDNLIFIAAYDKDYLAKSLENLNIPNSRNYLEKIFQSEFILYSLSLDESMYLLKQKMLSEFHKENDKKKIENLFVTSFFGNTSNTEALHPFKVYRNIEHFVNDFQNSNRKLSDEVDFESLFLVNILKYFYKNVYDEIYENSNFYFKLDSYDVLKREIDYDGLIDDKPNTNKPYIYEYIDQLQLDIKDKACITFIIKSLFENVNYKGYLSISKSNNFRKYFTGIIPNTIISNKKFKEIINDEYDISLLDKNLYLSFINIFKAYPFEECQKPNAFKILFFLIKNFPEYRNYEDLFEDKIINKNKIREKEFIDIFFNEIKNGNIDYKIKLLYVFAEIGLENKNQYLSKIKEILDEIILSNQKMSIDEIKQFIDLHKLLILNLSDKIKKFLEDKIAENIKIDNSEFIKRLINPIKQNGRFYYNIYDGSDSIFANVFDSDLDKLNDFLGLFKDDKYINEIIDLIYKLKSDNIIESPFSDEFKDKFSFEKF